MSAEAGTQPRVSPAQIARRDHIPLAVFYMIASGAVFNCANAASKWLIATYPIGEVLFVRTLVALLTMGMFIIPMTGFAVYRTRKLGAHLMRATSQVGSQTMLLIAFSLMPLAGATAIMFSSPIFSTLASAYFLGEKVGTARWSVLLIGFLGVLIIANPGADSFQIGALFALGNAILFGTVVAGVRGMSTTESSQTLVMYQLTFLTAVY
ncbi:MAG: DMT family transporter, partial [Alphaproteobacteria bacterium]|nr:DMT family transporter [Alphaproteobacteria bacterium]